MKQIMIIMKVCNKTPSSLKVVLPHLAPAPAALRQGGTARTRGTRWTGATEPFLQGWSASTPMKRGVCFKVKLRDLKVRQWSGCLFELAMNLCEFILLLGKALGVSLPNKADWVADQQSQMDSQGISCHEFCLPRLTLSLLQMQV